MDGIGGMAELRVRLERMKAATTNVEPALLRAGVVVLKAAMDRIDAGGPGWPANKTHTPLLHKTGRLLGSLTVSAADNISRVSGNEIIVGTNVPYARYLQDGTSSFARGSTYSMFGRKATTQGPRANAHTGIPPRVFLKIDDQAEAVISKIFAKHIMGADAPGA